jgi:hypothetical protein
MSRSDDYRAGYHEELARQVAKNLGRDNARKQRILAACPSLYAIDAAELNQMSARELATEELKQYGIKVSDASDPVEVRDAFHAGRLHERRGPKASGMDSASPSFVDKYCAED